MPLYKRQMDKLFYANIAIKLPLQTPDYYFDRVFQIMEEIDEKYNSYSPNSLLSHINKNAGAWTEVDETMYSILKRGYGISELFQGQYDISIFPLLQLWGFYKNKVHTFPSITDLASALKCVDYRQIEFGDNQIKIAANQILTSGSFIKAFAVDAVLDFFHRENIADALINAGGSTIFALANEKQAYWLVNISDENSPIPNSLFKIKLKNKCLSTSIQFQNSLEIEGEKIGHIINAKTGLPASNRQVGIISQNAMLGDMLSTAFMTWEASDFQRKMLEVQALWSDIEGFLLDGNGKLYTSEGFPAYIL